MRLRSISLALLPLALGVCSLTAHADTFDWTITGPSASLGGVPETGGGTLIATDTAGTWTVNSITGTLGGSNITGLTSFFGSDNLLFPSSTLLDTSGLAFVTASGVDANIFSFYAPGSDVTPGNNYGEFLGGTASGFGVGTFTLTPAAAPTPEPSSLALLGTGLLGAAEAARRRIRS